MQAINFSIRSSVKLINFLDSNLILETLDLILETRDSILETIEDGVSSLEAPGSRLKGLSTYF